MIITDNFLFDLMAIATTIIVGVVAFLKWKLTHWKREGFPTLNPTIPFGDTKDLLMGRATFGEQFREIYKQMKAKNLKYAGAYIGTKPVFVPIDLEIIKHILTKDFQHFANRGYYIYEDVDPLSGHLVNLEGARWKNMRVKLTPTFTSGRIKMMFQTLVDCAVGLKDIMDESATKRTILDIKDALDRFTTDIIGSVAFGIKCNSLKNPDAEFRTYGRKIFEAENVLDVVKFLMTFVLPHSLLKLIRFRFNKKDVEQFFMKAVHNTVQYREKNNIYRKDFMHLLLQLKNRGVVTDDEKITDEHGKTQEKALTMSELTAQVFLFFAAGYETSSTATTFTLYELARHPEIQDKVREEINTVLEKHGGKLTYEAIMEMNYMTQVINETLRKYPTGPVLNRRCTQDYTIPGTTLQIRKGDDVVIPILGIHNDPDYWPNPEKFDPERFTEQNKQSRPAFTWLPFGEGPRICIGLRLGMVQNKVGLTTILKNYKITLNKKTKLPLKFHQAIFVTTVEGGIWLNVEKID